ncbi:MAG TPA: class I SAM-dependent methyltransferase [Candidatus Binatia bacterium]|nr:class I SAM-dependent methyltransferase [Candidatus Binatia bacterium]
MSRRQANGTLSQFCGSGLEIGGPSNFFRPGEEFPVYSVAARLDNVNFSSRTFWEGSLREGDNFTFSPHKPNGRQFIREAGDLAPIPDQTYDFVISCHTLEHCANPVKALHEWRRVLKTGGCFALILPHKAGTFDHRRNVSTLEHLIEDYRSGTAEDDATHFAEILEKHDLKRDPGQKSRADFEAWITNNIATRGAHHHVFDPALAVTLVDYAGFNVITAETLPPFHIFVVGQKAGRPAGQASDVSRILQACYERSPFKEDRQKRNRYGQGSNHR